MIFEIRDYHYRPELLDAYRRWAEEAVPVLRKHLDVVGFWVDGGVREPEITGSAPHTSPLGSANVCWVIRWESLAARDAGMKEAFAGPDWGAVWAKHPDANGYRQISCRFMDGL